MAQNYGKSPSGRLRAYGGSESYIFISYAHRDSDKVLPIIAQMMADGYRVWFDEGIDPGTEWDSFIAEHIGGCAYFIALMSENYLASDNCKDELNFVRDLGKPRLLVYLENVTLPTGMQMRLGRLQAIHKYTYSDEQDFYKKLYDAEDIHSCLPQTIIAERRRRDAEEAERRIREFEEAQRLIKEAEEAERRLKEAEEAERRRKETREEAAHKRGGLFMKLRQASERRKEAKEAERKRKEPIEKLMRASVGDDVTFGTYRQSDIFDDKEEIEWRVLDQRNGKILLISKYALDCQRYNKTREDVTWQTCSLRTWLNNDFLQAAFSPEERAFITTVTVPADKNPSYSTNPGNATQDQVFLLSIPEAKRHFGSDAERQCKTAKYAVAQGAYVRSSNGNCWWWLRSPGDDLNYAAYVYDDGDISENGYYVSNSSFAVRPALWIDLNS